MRSWSLLFVFLVVPLLLAARTSGGAPPSLRGDIAAAVAVDERREQHHGGAPVPEGGAFYWKVGRFAVMVHSMWHGIEPVPRLERVVSASTRPAAGGGGGLPARAARGPAARHLPGARLGRAGGGVAGLEAQVLRAGRRGVT